MNMPSISDMRQQIGTIQYHHFAGTNAIVCCIKVKNGLTFLGTAQAAGNFDKQIGEATAYEHAEAKYFEAELYLKRQKLLEYVTSETNVV